MITVRPLAVAALAALLALSLSGCGIPGGIAYAIKEGGKEVNKNSASSSSNGTASDEQGATAAPPDVDPPPAPTAAPRDTISVETLK